MTSRQFTKLRSTVAPLLRDDVDTDQIIPARFLKTTNKTGLDEYLFIDWRKDSEFVLNQPQHRSAQFLLAGENFGCGSSREHAPWALTAWGFRAVIARSFADIFKSNALKNGLVPVELSVENHQLLTCLAKRDANFSIEVDLVDSVVRMPDCQDMPFAVDAFARDCLLEGLDQLSYLQRHAERIKTFEVENAK